MVSISAALALLTLAGIWAAFYLRGARKPELIYRADSPSAAFLAQLPRLNRRFWPTPWWFNAHLQIVGLCLREALAAPLKYDRVDRLQMADGGTTALHWLGFELAADVPTIVVLHTIAGDPQNMRCFVGDVQRLTGWRVVLCLRRGHGDLPFSPAKFNTLGDVDDLRQQLNVITRALPESPIYAAGTSAGTGLLVRYLGEQGTNTPIKAAFAFCPGYDVSVAFARSKAPYSKIMARRLVERFVTPNRQLFEGSAVFEALEASADLDTFQRHLYELAGYANYDDYLAACNPAVVLPSVSVPILVLNAQDDPVCVAQNVEDHRELMAGLPNSILAITARGSHCAYLSGFNAAPWAHQLAAEYFMAVNAQRQ